MANQLAKNITQTVGRNFIDPFKQDMVVLNTIDKSIIPTGKIGPHSGNTYQVKRPHQYKTARTSGGDLTSVAKSSLNAATATATVQDYFSEWVEYSQLEEAINLGDLDKILKPITTKIANDVELDVNGLIMKNGAHQLGTSTQPVDAWGDVAQVSTFASDLGFNSGELYAQITPKSRQLLADAQTGLNNEGLVASAWSKAQINKDFGGVMALTSNSLNTFTSGTDVGGTLLVDGAPTVTYAANKDTYQLTVTIDGFTGSSAVVPAGTVFQFDNIKLLNQQSKQLAAGSNGAGYALTGVSTADVTLEAVTQGTFVLSVLAVSESGDGINYNSMDAVIPDGSPVTVLSGAASAVSVPNLFYTKKSFGVLSVELPKLHSIDSTIINFDGMSFRCHKFSDGTTNQQLVRFDYLPAYAVYNPMSAGRFFGNA